MTDSASSSSKGTTFGWVLWRGGLWFCGLYIGWEGTVRMWQFLLSLELPEPVLVGIVMIIAGCILVFASLIMERVHDARLEAEMLNE